MSGGDIRSVRAQKDAKRFDKKKIIDKENKITEEKSEHNSNNKNITLEKDNAVERLHNE